MRSKKNILFSDSVITRLSPILKFRVSGASMSPTLRSGTDVLVVKYVFFSHPKLSDIVVCKNPFTSRVLVKRITKIVGKKYFVQGDNKKESTDSRSFGTLRRTDLIGKVVAVLH